MTKQFINRVLRELTVDTKQYRYNVVDCHNLNEQWREIRRLPLSKLDTTAALTDWKTVYDSREGD